jgi:hypothetical protein
VLDVKDGEPAKDSAAPQLDIELRITKKRSATVEAPVFN